MVQPDWGAAIPLAARPRVMEALSRLWHGTLPLSETYWTYAIFYGLLLNLASTLAFFVLILAEASMVLPIFAFLLPLPYNLLVLVAVWRSADRYSGPRIWADLARVTIVLWVIGMSLL